MCIGGMMLNSYISISKYKFFILSTISVLLLLIVLHIMYFEKFSHSVLKNDLSAKLFHFIQNEGNTIKVSAIGTSHTSDALKSDAKYFFNYGRPSTWYPQVAYAKVSHLIKYAPHLKVLLLEVDHISILGYDSAIHDAMPVQFLYLLKHVEETLDEADRPDMHDEKSTFFLSLTADVAPVIHRKFFQDYLIKRGKKKENVNYWAKLTSKEKIERAKKRVHSYRLDSPSKIDQATRSYYEKAIIKAKEHGIKIYLVYYPQTKEYLAEINKENNVKVDNFVSSLASENNVTVLDYRHYFESDESFFKNQDHINEKASKVFTQEVLQVIKNDL